MKKKTGLFLSSIFVLLVILVILVSTQPIMGNIGGSAHDFSARGWSNGEICLPCHTPHNADTTVMGSPLWNHQVTGSTFIVYTSLTMKSTAVQPRGPSKLCLSCHDGTVALDSFGGNTGSDMITGVANIGTSLTDDHPISIYWSHQNEVGTICLKCHNPRPTDFNPILPFYDRYLECSTCHDVHNKTSHDNLLRLPMNNSELCFHCHGK
ncbi:MAG: cytochrome C [bacterium]|nr:cytochrome C [bacterium]